MQHGVYIIPIATGIIYFGVGSSNFNFAVINMAKVNDIITDDSNKTGGQPVLGIRWRQIFHAVTYMHPSPMAPLYVHILIIFKQIRTRLFQEYQLNYHVDLVWKTSLKPIKYYIG